MRCWACRHPFQALEIRRDSLLRGRDPKEGGPWRSYRCPRCQRWSCAEDLPGGGIYISPEKDIGILDYLFGWIDPLAPDDFLLVLRWKQDHHQERRQIFETRRDYRYSGGWLWRTLQRLLARGTTRSKKSQQKRSHRPGKEQEGDPAAEKGQIPHPFQVLGLTAEASGEEIRSAFRSLVRKYHPDKLQGADDDSLDIATRRLKELIEAYEKLNTTKDTDTAADS